MKRFARRTIGVLIGLTLGWYAAGQVDWSNTTYADPPSDAKTPMASYEDDPNQAIFEHSVGGAYEKPADGHGDGRHGSDQGRDPHAGASSGGHHDDPGMAAAELLMPKTYDQVCWHRPVVFAAGGWFIAAVVLGIPALALRGPEPPEAPDPHHHDAHDHSHDAHH